MTSTLGLKLRQKLILSFIALSMFLGVMPANAQLIEVHADGTSNEVSNDAIWDFFAPTKVPALPEAKEVPVIRTKYVEMTAYNSEPGQTDDTPFITANNTRVRDGIVATNALPFNTRIRIPALYGDRVFLVTDRMNKRYTDRVDIWMEKHSDAIKFGLKRNVKIEILGK